MVKNNVVYTKQMAAAIRQIKQPVRGLSIDIVKYPEFLTIRMYENNIMSYDINDRVKITDYVNLVRKVIESYGVRCEFEGIAGDGPNRVRR